MQNIKRKVLVFFVLMYSFIASAEKTILIIGPPGSGKGTQTVLLRNALQWPLIAGSNIIRDDRLKDGDFGKVRDAFRDSRQVLDILKLGVVIKRLVENRLNNIAIDGIILDSWPKHPPAFAMAKEAIFKDDAPLIIELVVDKESLINRAVQRKVCPNSYCCRSYGLGFVPDKDGTCNSCGTQLFQRSGDNPNHFASRVEKYFDLRSEIIKANEKLGFEIHKIDGNRKTEIVHADIMELVEKYNER